MWFIDQGSEKVGRIDHAGKIVEFSLPGSSSGNDLNLEGIAVGPDGNIWFSADSSGVIVGRVTPQGSIAEFPLALDGELEPSLAVGPDGKLWVPANGSMSSSGQIALVSSTGEATYIPYDAPVWGMTPGPRGAMWLIGNEIDLVAPDGNVTPYDQPGDFGIADYSPQSNGLTSVAAAKDGTVWFLSNSTVNPLGRLSPGGAVSIFSGPDDGGINSLTIAPDGRIWYVEGGDDAGNFDVIRLDLSDALLTSAAPVRADYGSTLVFNVASFIEFAPGIKAADFKAQIEWGDGTKTAGTIAPNTTGGFDVRGTHDLPVGDNSMTVKITDLRRHHMSLVKSTITLAAPQPLGQSMQVRATAGQPFDGPLADFSGVALNSLSQYKVQIDWGGSLTSGTLAPDGHGGAYVVGMRLFAHSGTYIFNCSVYAPSGLWAGVDSTVTVSPGVLEGTGYTVIASPNRPVTDTVATFVPVRGGADFTRYHATFAWHDPTTGALSTQDAPIVPDGVGGFGVSFSLPAYRYSAPLSGMVEFQVAVTDDRLGSGDTAIVGAAHGYVVAGYPAIPFDSGLTYDVLVPLAGPPPVPPEGVLFHEALNEQVTAIGLTLSAKAGTVFSGDVGTVGGVLPDVPAPPQGSPGSPDPTTLHGIIRWGDGVSSDATFVLDARGVIHVRGTHPYGRPGSYAIVVDITQALYENKRPWPYPTLRFPPIKSTASVGAG